MIRRKEGQRLRLLTRDGEVIWVSVTRTVQGSASVVICAPQSVLVSREELLIGASAPDSRSATEGTPSEPEKATA